MATAITRDVGELLCVGFEGTTAPTWLTAQLRAQDAGSVILFSRNLAVDEHDELSVREHLELLASVRACSDQPIAISVDQEGGRVQRARAPVTRWPPMYGFEHVGADAPKLAEAVGNAMAAELAALDFDVDFAPVLDIHTNEANPIIGDRAFGKHPDQAAERALAFAKGLAAGGVVGCGKHYPGHGDTSTDSHLELPRLDHDMKRLREVELFPFARAAEAKLPMLMTAHVVFAALDELLPATLSRMAIHDLLRGELRYDGVVVSDDLDMRAIADNYGIDMAATAAIEAGCDLLLLCRNPDHQEQARVALNRKAASSSQFRDRVAQSASRIRRLKKSHFATKRQQLPVEQVLTMLNTPAAQRLADRLREAIDRAERER